MYDQRKEYKENKENAPYTMKEYFAQKHQRQQEALQERNNNAYFDENNFETVQPRTRSIKSAPVIRKNHDKATDTFSNLHSASTVSSRARSNSRSDVTIPGFMDPRKVGYFPKAKDSSMFPSGTFTGTDGYVAEHVSVTTYDRFKPGTSKSVDLASVKPKVSCKLLEIFKELYFLFSEKRYTI